VASANVELIRSLYADWERGDYRSSEWADPEIEWTMADGPDPGTWRGVAGMAEGFRSSMGVWTDVRADVQEYRELDDERVLVLEARRARGRASGLELEKMRAEGAVLFHVRDGKVTRLIFYWDRERALADLGLEQQDAAR
jgi:ketosteroid isomerase-like protein